MRINSPHKISPAFEAAKSSAVPYAGTSIPKAQDFYACIEENSAKQMNQNNSYFDCELAD